MLVCDCMCVESRSSVQKNQAMEKHMQKRFRNGFENLLGRHCMSWLDEKVIRTTIASTIFFLLVLLHLLLLFRCLAWLHLRLFVSIHISIVNMQRQYFAITQCLRLSTKWRCNNGPSVPSLQPEKFDSTLSKAFSPAWNSDYMCCDAETTRPVKERE